MKNNYFFLLLLVVPFLIVPFLAQCGAQDLTEQQVIEAYATSEAILEKVGGPPPSGEILNDGDRTRVRRVVDREAGVVCYLFGQQIECLPVGETRLK